MAARKAEIREWLERAKEQGASHVIVVCNTFDHEDYPVFVKPDENAQEKSKEYDGKNMQKIEEVYNLSMDIEVQLNQDRAFNL